MDLVIGGLGKSRTVVKAVVGVERDFVRARGKGSAIRNVRRFLEDRVDRRRHDL